MKFHHYQIRRLGDERNNTVPSFLFGVNWYRSSIGLTVNFYFAIWNLELVWIK